jgi:hypothetical protein
MGKAGVGSGISLTTQMQACVDKGYKLLAYPAIGQRFCNTQCVEAAAAPQVPASALMPCSLGLTCVP